MGVPSNVERHIQRIDELIEDGVRLLATKREGKFATEDERGVGSFFASASLIIKQSLGEHSDHFQSIETKLDDRRLFSAIERLVGILEAGKSDLQGGFIQGLDRLVAADVFDEILEQARELTRAGYVAPAAVLMRTALENGLRRIARDEGLDDSAKASSLNDALLKANRYAKPQWRLLQVCLDIGNAAAHGKSEEYKSEQVERACDDVERFWAQEVSRRE
jgi:hypothetical protein